jgi:hypothetical protein
MHTDSRHSQYIGRKVGTDRCLLRRSNVARGLGVLVEALIQHQAAAPPVASEKEGDAVRRFREALEPSSGPAPWPPAEHESEAVRRLQDALEGSAGAMQR